MTMTLAILVMIRTVLHDKRRRESVCGWIGESTLEKKAEMERNGWMGEKDKDPKRKRREVSTRYGK